MSSEQFLKYHGLGNDYLVLMEPAIAPVAAYIRAVCDRHRGLGSDGVLAWQRQDGGELELRIFNPDGSEAEKSGNGLRIFARFAFDEGLVPEQQRFAVLTKGGRVVCEVLEGGRQVRVAMGRATFDPRGPLTLQAAGKEVSVHPVSMGNPHCVVIADEVAAAEVQRLGPALEHHAVFPGRTNVQLVKRITDHEIAIEIWERGAGYTLASGSSSCAAAAVAVRLGLCASPVRVQMPGGALMIGVNQSFDVTMQGSVERIGRMTVDGEAVPVKPEGSRRSSSTLPGARLV